MIFLEANRQEYYERLLDVSLNGAWEAWLLFFLEGVYQQAEDACLRITRLQELRETYLQLISRDRSRKALELLLDYLIGSPITSINSGSRKFKHRQLQYGPAKYKKAGITWYPV